MIEMMKDMSMPKWRNFAAWSAVGAIVYILFMWAAIMYLNQAAMDVILRPTRLTAVLGLVMIFSAAVAGFSNRKRPFTLAGIGGFLILNVASIAAFLLATRGFRALAQTGAMSISDWVAAGTGAALVFGAILGSVVTASTRTKLNLVVDEAAAEEMRERGRSFFYSFTWIAAWGLLLIGLSLAGPGGLLSPIAAGAAALFLIVILMLLTIASRRLSDELGRTLSREAGNVAFYLVLVLGGGWAMLAHLGFAVAPAPLDWLTLFTLLLFAATFIALGRRKLLTR
jgi:hypothetical protein